MFNLGSGHRWELTHGRSRDTLDIPVVHPAVGLVADPIDHLVAAPVEESAPHG